MARTDIHRPSAIIPEDYVFICAFSFSEAALMPGVLDAERKILEQSMAHTGGDFSTHEHGGSCHVCGAWMKDYAVFYHAETNSYIRTGFDCAQKLDFNDPDLFRRFKDRRLAAEKAKAGKLKAEGLIEEMGLDLEVALSLFKPGDFGGIASNLNETYKEVWNFEQHFWTAVDMVRNLVKYGSFSDKQWAYFAKCLDTVKKAPDELANKAEREAQRMAEKEANCKPAPEGRLVVKGKVISTKVQEGQYGYEHKMLVESVDGWRVYLTVPSAIGNVEKGWEVEFTATIKPSNDDKFFAFGSRPSKASITKQREEE